MAGGENGGALPGGTTYICTYLIQSQGGTRYICTYLIHSSPGPLNQADPQRTSAIPAAHGDLQCYPPSAGRAVLQCLGGWRVKVQDKG
jgi:hypothetical protein